MIKDITSAQTHSLCSGTVHRVLLTKENGYINKFDVLSRGTGNCQMSIVENFNVACYQLSQDDCKQLLNWIRNFYDRPQVLLNLNVEVYKMYPFLADWAIVNQPYQNANNSEMVLLIVRPQ